MRVYSLIELQYTNSRATILPQSFVSAIEAAERELELMRKLEAVVIRAETWQRAAESKQAKVDALMWEFCPGEMTPEQKAEWSRHQTSSPPARPPNRDVRK